MTQQESAIDWFDSLSDENKAKLLSLELGDDGEIRWSRAAKPMHQDDDAFDDHKDFDS
jgi:hypothetical protein